MFVETDGILPAYEHFLKTTRHAVVSLQLKTSWRRSQSLSGLTIEEVSVPQLVAMGDGLLTAGQYALAKGMYGVALARAPRPEKQQIRTRIGLCSTPNNRTLSTFQILQALEKQKFANPFVADGLATWLKTLPFAADGKFQELAEKHASLLPLANWHWNLNTALWAVQSARHVPGDFIELGVFKGHTTLFCAEYVDFQAWPKTWWLFDTFDGIPQDQQAPGWSAVNKNLYQGTFSHEEVTQRFGHFPNIKVLKGRVPDVLAHGAPEAIAFMHIDMNNAPAEIGALEVLFERVSDGGIILFDDYCWDSARTQFAAEKAWFEDRGLFVLGMPTGQGLFIKKG